MLSSVRIMFFPFIRWDVAAFRIGCFVFAKRRACRDIICICLTNQCCCLSGVSNSQRRSFVVCMKVEVYMIQYTSFDVGMDAVSCLQQQLISILSILYYSNTVPVCESIHGNKRSSSSSNNNATFIISIIITITYITSSSSPPAFFLSATNPPPHTTT